MPSSAMPKAGREGFRRLGVEHTPLRDMVAEELRAAITSGRLAPGERLIEDRLAEDLGVSRNPVREAIRMLAAEGLLEVETRRGAIVASLSGTEAEELLEVRATLEAANAKLAAKRRDPETLKRLGNVLARGTSAAERGDLSALPSLNDEFHAELALAGRNRVMADLMKTLRDRTASLFRGKGVDAARTTWAEHAGILRAVIAGDADLSASLAHQHVLNAGRQTPPEA